MVEIMNQKSDIKVGMLVKGEAGYAVALSDGSFINENGTILKDYDIPKQKFHRTRNVNPEVRRILLEMAKQFEKYIAGERALAAMAKKRQKIMADKDVIMKNIKSLQFELRCANVGEVSPNECCTMSFYEGTLDMPRAIAIVKANTKRPYYYRFGFAFKGADTHKISQQEAIDILMEHKHFTDFTAYEDKIIINQYSDNDMF